MVEIIKPIMFGIPWLTQGKFTVMCIVIASLFISANFLYLKSMGNIEDRNIFLDFLGACLCTIIEFLGITAITFIVIKICDFVIQIIRTW